jgi:hypothetical protein
MAFVLLIFFVAAAISSVAAYFSLVGLGSIFAATFWGVVIMGASLEVGKIVTAKWIHVNWRNPAAPWHFRGLLCFFVACLMAITSLGVYGYLSKGHLEQKAPLAGLGVQVAQLEVQLKQKQDENGRLEGRLSQISKITDKVLEGNARAGLRASNQSKKEAAEIQKTIDANNTTINDITQKLVPLKMKTGEVEGEIGVAKFIAEALGWNPEKAIRIIIALIMAAFDPLAIAMFIMGSISLQKLREEKATKEAKVIASIPPVEMVPVADLLVKSTDAMVDETTNIQVPDAFESVDYPHIKTVEEEAEIRGDARQEIYDSFKASAGKVEKLETSSEENLTVSLEEFANLEAEVARLATDNELLRANKERLRIREAQLAELIKEAEERLTDTRPSKQKILDMLEENPEFLEEIIDVVDSAKSSKDSN